MASKNEQDSEVKVAVVMVPFPAQSHLNMLFNFALELASYCDANIIKVPIHFASSTQHINQLKIRHPQATGAETEGNISFHENYMPFNDNLEELPSVVPHLNEPITDLIRGLSTEYSRVIVVHDVLMTTVIEEGLKSGRNIEAYNFRTISAFSIFFNMWQAIPDGKKPFKLPEDSAWFPRWLPSLEDMPYTPEFLAFVVRQIVLCASIEGGRVYNTSRVVDAPYLGLIEKMLPNVKHYAVGPLLGSNLLTAADTTGSCKKLSHSCLEWLNCQEDESVLYMSFGTTIPLPKEQVKEIAQGLEKSDVKFLWVLRNADKGDVSATEEFDNDVLPEGFAERVANRGLVVTDWAPQRQILAHRSIGGFLTHCGWGSLNESLTEGVPVVAWPAHSDHPLNSVLVTEVLKVGLLVRDDFWETRSELVTSDMVERSVTSLMATEEGEVIRARAKEIGEKLQESMVQGGAASLDMESFIAHITRA